MLKCIKQDLRAKFNDLEQKQNSLLNFVPNSLIGPGQEPTDGRHL